MKSSMNSETVLSRQHDTKTLDIFDMEFRLHVVTEERPEWSRVFRHPITNEVIDTTRPLDAIQAELAGHKPVLNWEKTGKTITCSYLQSVYVRDNDECKTAKPIELLSTPDGPILGIILEVTDTEYVVLDPCFVKFENDQVSYLPIFNVARTLRLMSHAVRARQAPAEVLVASYPGFIVQNRMYMYQLKPAVAFAKSETVTNAAEDVSTRVTH